MGQGGDILNKWKFSEFMHRAGYTQKTLAQDLGMSKTTLNNKLNGRGSFTPEQIVAICERLSIVTPNDKCEIFLP